MGPTPIQIVPWSREWPRQYEAEIARIGSVVTSLTFHHIGSTSIPGCAAKPIIDIMGVVGNAERFAADRWLLSQTLGYESLGEYGVPGRDFFFRYTDANFHISVFRSGDENIANNLRFRDRLTTDQTLRERYVALKDEAANAHRDDHAAYNAYKSELIAEILRR